MTTPDPTQTTTQTRQGSLIPQTPAPPQNPLDPILPAPETFDILPHLQVLLSRLLLPSAGLQAPFGEPSHVSPNDSDTAINGTGHLDIQELGAAVGAVRIRVQKARMAVRGLPDVERTVEEQESEIRSLESRIERMRAMLGGLGGEGS